MKNDHRENMLSKAHEDEDFKYIDTSVDSDLPPTLSSLQNKHRKSDSLSTVLNVPKVSKLW